MKRFLMILLVVVVVVPGCKRTSSPGQTQTPSVATSSGSPVQHLANAEGGGGQVPDIKYLRGTIGNLELQMRLVREGDKLSGSYFYQKVGKKLDLRGSLDKEGHFLLDEFDGEKHTGVFKGLWTVSTDSGEVSISGDWSTPDGQKTIKFSLESEPVHFSGGIEIVAKKIKETNKKLNYEIEVEYPELTGLLSAAQEKFNQTVSKMALKQVNDFRKDMTESKSSAEPDSSPGSYLDMFYSIAAATDEVISLEFAVGTYYRGSAHPNSNSEVVNFDLRQGKLLNLADLFKPGSKYLQTISSYAINDLKKQSKEDGEDRMLDDESIENGAGPGAKNFQSWTITRKGLSLTFDAYQVGPYAAGPQQVLVPYSVLKEIIEPSGVLTPFTKPSL